MSEVPLYWLARSRSAGFRSVKPWTSRCYECPKIFRHFTETKVESGTSQSKSGASVNLSDSGDLLGAAEHEWLKDELEAAQLLLVHPHLALLCFGVR